MLTKKNDDNKIFLFPGKLVISKEKDIIWTILGSCISIIFYHRKTQLSAMCHALLASKEETSSCKENCPNPCGMNEQESDFKYVTCSFRYMLDQFQKSGIPKSEIEVSLYGGAAMFDIKNRTFNIGVKNIEKAKDLIKQNNLQIINENVGGTRSRSITYFPKTGKIELKITPTTEKL